MGKLGLDETRNSLSQRSVETDIQEYFGVLDQLVQKFDDYTALPAVTLK